MIRNKQVRKADFCDASFFLVCLKCLLAPTCNLLEILVFFD